MDSKKRQEGFLEGYRNLTEKYKLDFVSVPSFVPDEKGGWRVVVSVQVFDTENIDKQKEDLNRAFVSNP